MPRLFHNFNKVTQIQEPRVYKKDEKKKATRVTRNEFGQQCWETKLNEPKKRRRISVHKFIGDFSIELRLPSGISPWKILNFLLHRLHSFCVQSLRAGESRTESGLLIMRPFPEGNCVPVA